MENFKWKPMNEFPVERCIQSVVQCNHDPELDFVIVDEVGIDSHYEVPIRYHSFSLEKDLKGVEHLTLWDDNCGWVRADAKILIGWAYTKDFGRLIYGQEALAELKCVQK